MILLRFDIFDWDLSVAIVEAIKTLPVEVQEEIALKIKEVLSLAMSSVDFPKKRLSILEFLTVFRIFSNLYCSFLGLQQS